MRCMADYVQLAYFPVVCLARNVERPRRKLDDGGFVTLHGRSLELLCVCLVLNANSCCEKDVWLNLVDAKPYLNWHPYQNKHGPSSFDKLRRSSTSPARRTWATRSEGLPRPVCLLADGLRLHIMLAAQIWVDSGLINCRHQSRTSRCCTHCPPAQLLGCQNSARRRNACKVCSY